MLVEVHALFALSPMLGVVCLLEYLTPSTSMPEVVELGVMPDLPADWRFVCLGHLNNCHVIKSKSPTWMFKSLTRMPCVL